MDKFVIPLANGYKLISERNSGEFDKELYVGIEAPNGSYVQDLVIVRPTYRAEDDNIQFDTDKFEILVFGDAYAEDFTDKYTVPLYDEYGDIK